MAFVREIGYSGGGGARTQPQKVKPGGAGKTDGPQTRRCFNCGFAGHVSAACNKPQVDREKRPCWKCGGPGHLGRDCRGKLKH